MKILIIAILLNGCASMGTLLSGAGKGLQAAAQSPDPVNLNCVETYQTGNTQHFNCR